MTNDLLLWIIILGPVIPVALIRTVAISKFGWSRGRASLLAATVPLLPTLAWATIGANQSIEGSGAMAQIIYLLVPMMVLIGVVVGLVLSKLTRGELLG